MRGLAKGLMAVLVLGLVAPVMASPIEVWQGANVPVQFDSINGDLLGSSPVDFYNYYSESAHTGLEQPGKSNLYVYVYNGELALFSVHSQDNALGLGRVTQTFDNLPDGWQLLVKDDPNQDTFTPSANSLTADWFWINNTDGAALGLGAKGALDGRVITVTSQNWFGNVNQWCFVGGDGSVLMLDPTQPVNIRFVPEPAALVLLSIGTAAMLLRRK